MVDLGWLKHPNMWILDDDWCITNGILGKWWQLTSEIGGLTTGPVLKTWFDLLKQVDFTRMGMTSVRGLSRHQRGLSEDGEKVPQNHPESYGCPKFTIWMAVGRWISPIDPWLMVDRLANGRWTSDSIPGWCWLEPWNGLWLSRNSWEFSWEWKIIPTVTHSLHHFSEG